MTHRTPSASRFLGASLIALALAAPMAATAQTTPDAEEARRLPDVIVTAQKREESLQDVAQSVAAVSGEKLNVIASGAQDIQFLSARVPSVIIESSFGRSFPRPYIRGLGNVDFDLNASQPVSMIYDEVVYENPILKGFPVFDVDRIEVLRGPQGTLFGRNTPAGIIKFDSARPTKELDAYISGAVGSFDTIDIEGAVGGEVADGVSVRVSVLSQTGADWIDNGLTGAEKEYGDFRDQAVRAQVLFEPTEDFDALLSLQSRFMRGTSQPFRANIVDVGSNGLNANFDRDTVFWDGGDGANQKLQASTLTLRMNYDMGDIIATSVTGYGNADFFGRGDIDGGFGASFIPGFMGPGFIPFPSETADGVDDLTQWSQEFRLSSDVAGPMSWQGGLYIFSEDVTISSYNFDTLAAGAVNGFALQDQETSAWALFGSLTYAMSDQLSLTVGARYSDDEKDFTASRLIGPFGSGTYTNSVSVGDEALSWDLALKYDVDADTMVYGRVARGFRAPSIQGRVLFGNAVTTADSEFVTSFEAGAKSDLFDGRLRANGAVFYYTIEDQQLTAIGGAGNFNQLLNADEGVGYGFELELEAAPTDNLFLTAGVSYNNTEINDSGLSTGVCGAPCTVLDPIDPATGGALIDGNSFPNAPEWIASVTARYAIPFGDHGEWFVFTDWAFKGETNFFLYDSVEFTEDGYWEGGLRAGYAALDGGAEYALFARNITDEEARIGAIDFNNLTGFTNNPRFVGFEAIFRR